MRIDIVLKHQRVQGMQMNFGDRSNLPVLHRHAHSPTAISIPYGQVSSRNLDLFLLAVCSCLITMIAHPAASLMHFPSGGASSSSFTSSAATTTPNQLDFLIKSGLFASSRQSQEDQQEAQ